MTTIIIDGRKYIAVHDPPPIPVRNMDWQVVDDESDGLVVAYGTTLDEAIQNLTVYHDEKAEWAEVEDYAPCGCPGTSCIGECPSADLAVDAYRESRAFR